MLSTGLVWDERLMWHNPVGAGPLSAGGWVQPGQHAESAEGKRRIKNLLDASGLSSHLTQVHAREATREELLRIHAASYLDRLARDSEGSGGDAGDGHSPFGPGGLRLAALAAGGGLAAVEAVLGGAVGNAYVLVRPPGHHALADRGMGFCLLANGALAAAHARAQGAGRVAIVDWDAHHGNGTQAAFLGDPSVLTISLHQDAVFPPGSGGVAESTGDNINIPLPPGSGAGAYEHAFAAVVLPALRRFAPDLVIVACGFDSAGMDPHARLMLHSDAYRALTAELMAFAQGRVVAIHEGGYHEASVPFLALAVVETLAGVRTGVEDPFLANMAGPAGQELQPHQSAAVERAAAAAATAYAP
jgi:acetoin utilization deacetylase AcuC-like enzyme